MAHSSASRLFFERGSSPQDIELSRHVVRNITDELFSPRHITYTLEIDGVYAILINPPEGEGDARGEVLRIITHGAGLMEENFGFVLSGFVGKQVQGLENLPPQYGALRERLRYELFFGDSPGIHLLDESHREGPVFRRRYVDIREDYVRMVQKRKYSIGKLLFNQMLDVLKEDSGEIQHYHLQSIENEMILTLGPYLSSPAAFDFDPVERLGKAGTSEDFRQVCSLLFDRLTALAERPAHGDMTKVVSRARDIIDSSYSDPQLSVASIADMLGVNSSYLSREYKQCFGCGMLESIIGIRLEKARLMLTTSMTVREIAATCGFSSDISLLRSFKKQFGVAPGQYRAQAQEKVTP